MLKRRLAAVLTTIGTAALCAAAAHADTGDESTPSAWNEGSWYNLHGQSTFVYQYHPHFAAPLSGAHSLNPDGMGRETFDATLFAGVRPWQGVEFYVDPEIDQGFGLSDTLGVAGFPSGEAYKVGRRHPYYETQRAFGRFTIGLDGPKEKVDDGPNQIAGTRQANNLVITAGKLSATDIFDTNRYAHDPRADFLNWSIVDSGAYDYAANAWGYTYGGALEWNQNWWTLRVGYFTLSKVPNEVDLDPSFRQFELVTELEERHTLFDHPGKVKLLFFNNRGRMANYNDAVRLAQQTGTTPDVSLVRHYGSRPGTAINAEQEFTDDLGGFLRASLNDGHKESYEFTEINRSLALGLSLAGKRWHRPDDTVGLVGVVNDISKEARDYLAAGGLGILIGDGALPNAGFEKILEIYYKAAIIDGFNVTVDFQHVENPAYNALRGPVDVFGFRLHAEF
ncbi:MAG TPA: carbohydrate porin [Stellaceae bacterium]